MKASAEGKLSAGELEALFEQAVSDTIRELEATGSPVITDGEQRKPSFATYPIHGSTALRGDGVAIPFKDGHTRQLPLLTAGPFRYQTYASDYLAGAKKHAHRPVKQAVREAQTDIRRSLHGGADSVQIDFTEARLSIKLDPSKALLNSFVDLNNQVLEGFTPAERAKIGVHTCPGGDRDSTHSADVDYAELLPALFRLNVGRFYVQLASEADPARVLGILKAHARPGRTIFVGVTDPINPEIETPAVVRDRIMAAAKFIDPSLLGTTDDCGFSPFGDDASTPRATAFAKIRARIEGNELASAALGV